MIVSSLILLSLLALVAGGIAYQERGAKRDQSRFPPPGRLVDVGNTRLHLLETGNSTGPTVVLEAGIAGSLLGWSLVQPELSKFAHVLSYDRAGLGWSDTSIHPRTVSQMLDELNGLLSEANQTEPIILVGHSFGGLLVRAFAHRWPQRIAGLVLVDPVGIRTWATCEARELTRLQRGIRLSRRGRLLAQVGIVRGALAILAAGGRKLPSLIGRAAAGGGSSTLSRLVGEVSLLPPSVQPVVRSHWSNPKCFTAMAEYLGCLPQSAREAAELTLPANIPVTILSASNATEDELGEREQWAQRSRRGRHIRVPDTGHWIQVRRPEVVVEAVRDMVGA